MLATLDVVGVKVGVKGVNVDIDVADVEVVDKVDVAVDMDAVVDAAVDNGAGVDAAAVVEIEEVEEDGTFCDACCWLEIIKPVQASAAGREPNKYCKRGSSVVVSG